MINAKLLQLVVDASNDGIVVAEQEGEDNILIYANAAFERLTGYPAMTSSTRIAVSCRALTVHSSACRPFAKRSRRTSPADRSFVTTARMAARSGTSYRSLRC